MILEVSGEDGKIDAFANQLQSVLKEAAQVPRPQRTTVLSLLDIEATVTNTEILNAVRGGNAKVLKVKDMSRGLRKAKVAVPIAAALEVLKEKTLQVGWSRCRVRSLESEERKQPRCYKCLRNGHMAARCTNEEIGKACYRCGETDHLIRECCREPLCPLCSKTDGSDGKHILGTKGCLSAATSSSKRGRKPSQPKRR